MKKATIFLIVGGIMLMVAICFIAYAANHPEEFFPWPISITYIIYRLYLIVMICMFLTAIVLKIKKK